MNATTNPLPSGPPANDRLHALRWRDPFTWLAAGGRDLARSWRVSLVFGVCFWLMAVVLGAVFRSRPEYTMSFVSGCLLVGPFLAMGLYESSRRREMASRKIWVHVIDLLGHAPGQHGHAGARAGRAGAAVGPGVAGGVCGVFQHRHAVHHGRGAAIFNPENWEFVGGLPPLVGGCLRRWCSRPAWSPFP
jgi:hypothetical protein